MKVSEDKGAQKTITQLMTAGLQSRFMIIMSGFLGLWMKLTKEQVNQ
jgi:hypothetical protein